MTALPWMGRTVAARALSAAPQPWLRAGRSCCRVDELYFRERDGVHTLEDVLTHSSQLVALTRVLYTHLVDSGHPPAYVCGLGPGDIEVLTTAAAPGTMTAEAIREGRVEFIAWLQVFPPAVAAGFDRETLLSAPAAQVEQVPDGAVLLVVDTSPTMIAWTYEPEAVASHLELQTVLRPPRGR